MVKCSLYLCQNSANLTNSTISSSSFFDMQKVSYTRCKMTLWRNCLPFFVEVRSILFCKLLPLPRTYNPGSRDSQSARSGAGRGQDADKWSQSGFPDGESVRSAGMSASAIRAANLAKAREWGQRGSKDGQSVWSYDGITFIHHQFTTIAKRTVLPRICIFSNKSWTRLILYASY